ncbi:MAG TPA: sugar phosphate isomerase/epimerase family protein [Armatimonadota bacterium]|nr:sugar phosphate isomerase/epimerase family protein [Armatimonadota bacterium]
MLKGISRWSLPPDIPLDECFRRAKQAGFDGLELSFDGEGDLGFSTTQAEAESIRRTADSAGMRIAGLATGFLWDHSLTASDPEVRGKGIAAVDKMLDIAAWLGVDAILVVPGSVDVFFLPDAEVVPYDTAYERSRDAIAGLVSKAEANKVTIGLENVWNKFLLSPLELRGFIDSFGSERVGSYFDVGNTLLMGYPEHWIPILGKRIARVHVKDFRKAVGTADGFVDLGEGDVNWSAVMGALRGIGYDGFVTAEMIPAYKHIPDGTLYAASRALDGFFAL